jgi:hypothetical protein
LCRDHGALVGVAAKSSIHLALATRSSLAPSVLIHPATEAIVARARTRPMIKPSRSNSTQPAKADAPVILGADDLAAIDGGTHLIDKDCSPPPPPVCRPVVVRAC